MTTRLLIDSRHTGVRMASFSVQLYLVIFDELETAHYPEQSNSLSFKFLSKKRRQPSMFRKLASLVVLVILTMTGDMIIAYSTTLRTNGSDEMPCERINFAHSLAENKEWSL